MSIISPAVQIPAFLHRIARQDFRPLRVPLALSAIAAVATCWRCRRIYQNRSELDAVRRQWTEAGLGETTDPLSAFNALVYYGDNNLPHLRLDIRNLHKSMQHFSGFLFEELARKLPRQDFTKTVITYRNEIHKAYQQALEQEPLSSEIKQKIESLVQCQLNVGDYCAASQLLADIKQLEQEQVVVLAEGDEGKKTFREVLLHGQEAYSNEAWMQPTVKLKDILNAWTGRNSKSYTYWKAARPVLIGLGCVALVIHYHSPILGKLLSFPRTIRTWVA